MSGGVDSSVSAWILKKKGYYVEGLFMKNWEDNSIINNKKIYCNTITDLNDASLVCDKLGIILHIVNFSIEYKKNVFNKFINEYKLGYTPNPDVLCNKEIKFKILLKFIIKELKSDYIATGHYVRYVNIYNKNILLKGIDKKKDQSYFLYTLIHKQLKKCLFPIGNLNKTEVRNIAIKLNLSNAKKKDSVGICFIGKYKFREFLSFYIPNKVGFITTIDGEKIGKHKGAVYYTIGQRKGLNIGGLSNFKKKPWYVIDKDILNNTIIVSQNNKHYKLISTGFIIKKLNFIKLNFLKLRLTCKVKIRHQQSDINCLIKLIFNKKIIVIFNKPVIGVTIGQSAVFYILDFCIGGGVIIKRIF